MRWLPLILFFAYISIEVYVFIRVADALGLFVALGLVVLTSVIGLSLVRDKGFKNLVLLQQKMRDGDNPTEQMIKSVSLIVAGILLLLPGFVSDLFGFLLLLPMLQKRLLLKLMPHIYFRRTGTQSGRTFEGEYQRKDDNPHLRNPSQRDD